MNAATENKLAGPDDHWLVPRLDWKTISLASIGGGLEFYDFIIYGTFAQYIARVFFPGDDPGISMAKTFAVFAVGYLSRPLGGVVISHIGDRFGRRRAFLLSLLIMTMATIAMAVMPGFATIGLAAPICFIMLRFIQGCCVGGELPGAITYVVETAPHRAGLACGIMFFCVNTGAFIATFVSSTLHSYLSVPDMEGYGWRIGFAIGGVLGVIGFFLRSNLHETAVFKALGQAKAARLPAMEVLRSHWVAILIGIGFVSVNQAFITTLNVAMTPYLTNVAGYDVRTATVVVSYAVGLLSLGIVATGFASDFVPRRWILQAGTFLLMILSYPLYRALSTHSANVFLLFTMVALVCALVSGTFGTVAAELFPTRLRFSGLAIAYNLAAALLGGFAPLVTSGLVAVSGDKSAPGAFLAIVAGIGFLSALSLKWLQRPGQTAIER